MRKLLAALLMVLVGSTSAAAQISNIPHTFEPRTIIRSAEVNENFSAIANAALARDGTGVLTGQLQTRLLIPTSSNDYDIGASNLFYRTAYLRTSLVLGQSSGNYTLVWSNPAASRTLTIPDPGANDSFVFLAAAQALTNKTISLASNTLTGTIAQFNAALTDGDFATLAGSETLSNKTLNSPTITNASVSGGTFTSPSISNPTLSGSVTGNVAISTTGNVSITGNINSTGTVSAATFSGSGASLSGIPETAISDGNVLARIAANEVISGNWTFGSSSIRALQVGRAEAINAGVRVFNGLRAIAMAVSATGVAALQDDLDANPTIQFGIGNDLSFLATGGFSFLNSHVNTNLVQPGFSLYAHTPVIIFQAGSGPIIFDGVNHSSGHITDNNTFTAPVAGVYQFCASVDFDGAAHPVSASIVTSAGTWEIGRSTVSGPTQWVFSKCVNIYLNAGHTAQVWYSTSSAALIRTGAGATTFVGRLLL